MGDSTKSIITLTKEFVENKLANAEGGHDWWHIYRVWKMAARIAQTEDADIEIVELAALLHDIADPKFHGGDESIGPRTARAYLESQNVNEPTIEHIVNIIKHMSFKNSLEAQSFTSKEMEVVQDADRLDAIGAIGIARVFSFGGHKGNPIHDPTMKPKLNMSKEEYKKSNGTSLNHFYEKLFLLKDKMNTETGKKIAQSRHEYMEGYVERFYAEFEGKN